ncbi:winged helix-turn-helix domain-containing protein [Sphingobium sp. CR28]|uniref:winged helix-turn-helix domain-containing protein n=1 Tax=Sphingobium sp. CR28 TaxID=3400272 RepID=UPI003FEE0F0E
MQTGPLKLRAQLLCGDEIAMGPGKADLLDAIARTGSISAAGRDLGMSYRRSWMLVDAMNRCFAQPLVQTMIGGGKNRGARLTTAGEQALAAYRALEASIADAAASDLGGLAGMLRPAPLPAASDPEKGGSG